MMGKISFLYLNLIDLRAIPYFYETTRFLWYH